MHSPRQGLTDVLGPLHSPRQGLTQVADFSSPRQGITEIIGDGHSPRQGLTEVWSEAFAAQVEGLQTATAADWESSGRNVWDAPIWRATYAGQDISDLLGDLTIEEPLNGKSSFTLPLNNPVDEHRCVIKPSDLAPPGFGAFAGIIRQHNGTASRPFYFHVTSGGETWDSEAFVGLNVSYQDKLSWPLEDLSAILELDTGAYLPDIVRAAGDNVMAHAAAKQEADLAGIRVECRYPNYLLGEFRRGSGSILSRLDRLGRGMQAARRWERGVLIYEQVRMDAPHSWDFVDELNIQQLSIDEFPRQPNSFVLTRFTPGGGQIGEAAGGTVGRQRISFDPAKFVVIDQIKCIQGALLDWVFGSSAGTYLSGISGGGPPAYSGGIPAAWADFTYRPNIGATAYTPGYEVLARGGPLEKEGTYRFTAESAALQAIYGIVSAGKAIADPIYGDSAGAALGVQAWLWESIRKGWTAKFKCHFLNPHVRAGQIVRVKDKLRRQALTRWVVEKVSKSKRGPYGSMLMECTRGEVGA